MLPFLLDLAELRLDGFKRLLRQRRIEYELARRNQDNDHTRSLLREAADAALTRMPQLTRELRRLERLWDEQQLPELSARRRRQDEIARELQELVNSARRD